MPRLRAAAAAALLALAAADSGSKNPCHPGLGTYRAPACERVVIPAGFNAACALKPPVAANGNFVDCANIYDLDAPGCRASFEEYVDLNPCDDVRAGFVENWGAPASVVGLDYFAYGLLEQCCDTVEKGSNAGEYEARKAAGTLWSLTRGNGPAHFYYDIVGQIFPNFKYFGGECASDDPVGWPRIAPYLAAWQNGPAAENWVQNASSVVPQEIQRVILNSMFALECDNKAVWEGCLDLESKQDRVRRR